MEYHESKKMGDVGENEILKRVIKQYSLSYIDNIGKANSDWDIRVPEKDILNTPCGKRCLCGKTAIGHDCRRPEND